jgi:hypothetical protein
VSTTLVAGFRNFFATHLEPRADVVAKLARLVVPGGHVVFSEANGWNPLLQAFLFKLRGTKTMQIEGLARTLLDMAQKNSGRHARDAPPWRCAPRPHPTSSTKLGGSCGFPRRRSLYRTRRRPLRRPQLAAARLPGAARQSR